MSVQKACGFALLLVQVAAGDHVVDRQADAGVEVAAELEDVGLRERRVEVGVEDRRRLLEERIVVVPGHQVVDLDPQLLREPLVDLGLRLRERLAGQCVEVVEQLDEFVPSCSLR